MSGESKTSLESVKRKRDDKKKSHKKGTSAGAKDSSDEQLREFLTKTKNAITSGMFYDPILGKNGKAFIKEKGKSYKTHDKLKSFLNAAKKRFGPDTGNDIVSSMADFQTKLMTQRIRRNQYKMMRDEYVAQKNQAVAEPEKKKQKTKGQYIGESKESAGESKMDKIRREREEKMDKRAGIDKTPPKPEAEDIQMDQAQSLGKRRRKKNFKAMNKKLKYGMEVPSNVYVEETKHESKTPIETKEQQVAGAGFPGGGESKIGHTKLKPKAPGADEGANIDFQVNEILNEAEHNENMLNIPESLKRKPGYDDSGPVKKKARFGPQDKNPVLPKRNFDPGPDFPFPPPNDNYQIPRPAPPGAPPVVPPAAQPAGPQPAAQPGAPPPAGPPAGPPGGPPGGPPDGQPPEDPQLLEVTKGVMGAGSGGRGHFAGSQFTTLASQRLSSERNRMKHSAKRLLMEIRAFKQLYRDEIKTVYFRKLIKMCAGYTEKTPAIQLRKTHREMEEEVISFYQKASGLRLGVIIDPGAIGINVGQLQGILQPHAGFAGGGEVVRELANAAEAGTVPDPVKKVTNIHYTHGGYAVATKQVSPEGQNINSNINMKERIQLLRGRTARMKIPQEPKRRYMYQDRRRPFIPKNIKIKSVKH